METGKSHKPSVAVIGNQPEALLLSVLCAESKIPVFLTGQFETTIGRPSGRNGREEAAWLLGVHARSNKIRVIGDPAALPFSEIRHLIISEHGGSQSETNGIERTVRSIARDLVRGTSIILTGLNKPGTTKRTGELIQQFSGLQLGRDFNLSYLPILWSGEPLQTFRERPRILSTLDKRSSEVQEFLLAVFPTVTLAGSFAGAEAAGLFTPLYQDTVRALELELASFCEAEGVDYGDALELCKGAGLQYLGTPRTNPTRYSIATAIASSGADRRKETLLIRTARRVNEKSDERVLSLIRDALYRCGRRLRRSRIAILGLDGLRGRAETRLGTPPLVQMLNRRGAIVSLYPGDGASLVDTSQWGHLRIEKSISKAVEKTHCAVIAFDMAQDRDLNPQHLASEMSRPAAICDLTHVMEASNVERVGLVYSSIGRGSPEA